MSRALNYLLAILGAVGVTIVLWWVIAALFSFTAIVPEEEAEGKPEANVALVDSRNDPQIECLERTADLRQLVTNSKYCEQDSDCAVVRSHGKSPGVFRCMISVRREVADVVQAGFDQHRSCDIIENCDGFTGRPVCEKNLCQLAVPADETVQ